MTTTHTPGPWIARQGCDPYSDDPNSWSVLREAEPQYLIAIVENGAPGDTMKTEGHTARLIAAAPDLLAACTAAQRAMGSHGPCNDGDCDGCRAARRVVNAAIIKATGGGA